MLEKTKRRIALFVSISSIALMSITCYAVQSSYIKAFVDSNTYTNVTTATKDTYSTYATVRVNYMYKADGSNSNYQRLNVQLGSNGYQSPSKNIAKETNIDFPLASSYRSAGKVLYMYAMGNDSTLDCRISGYFNAN